MSNASKYIVVTDGKGTPSAHSRAQALRAAGLETMLVSFSWIVDALLYEQVPSTLDKYQVTTVAEVEKTGAAAVRNTEPDLRSERPLRRTVFRPVWNPLPEAETRTTEQRQEICNRLPEWMMARQTINSSLVKSPNSDLVSALRLVATKRELLGSSRSGDDGKLRALAYRKAAAAVAVVPFVISAASDVKSLRYVGKDSGLSTFRAIEQFFSNNRRIPELDRFDEPGMLASVRELTKVYGIGVRTACDLFEKYRGSTLTPRTVTVDDARRHYQTHSSAADVLVSLEHYEALQQPLTAFEAEEILRRVEATAASELVCRLKFKICGGFRRGALTGHDVDILYRHVDETCDASVINELVAALEREGLIIARLGGQAETAGYREQRFRQNSVHSGQGDFLYAHDTCLCIARTRRRDGSAGKACRVDFVGIRQAFEWPYAVVSWTGTSLWQRDLRRYANTLGRLFNRFVPHRNIPPPSPTAICMQLCRNQFMLYNLCRL
jgi:DNA polymerase/3'-5' exonuclease PolX